MFRPILRSRTALAVGALLVVLSAAPGAARPGVTARNTAKVAVAPAGLLSRLWNSMKVLWGEAGCSIDPNGARCANGTPGGTATVSPPPNGCTIDPNGTGCAAVSPAPAGCSIDPDGCIAR